MDLGGYSDRWRHRAWQVEPVSEDSDTASFDEYGASEDLPTSSFLPTGPVMPAASVNAPPRERPAATTYEIGVGSVLRSRYLIEKRIGEGGTSEVFSAIDRHRGNGAGGFNRLAIKILHCRYRDDEARTERLIREFRHMQRLTHPGIARVYDLDCENGLWFITMELLEGRPLSQRIRAGLQDGEALPLLTQCAEALAYAHDHAVVHGDLKPSNIFVTCDGSIRLLDFGSVPSWNEVATQSPSVHRRFAATPPYASPELLDGQEAQPRDDIFSLGCVAYELFSGGQHPFGRKSSLDARQQQLRPNYHGSMRPRHFAVIARALSWERNARPATARDFLHDFLASHFDHETTPQTTTTEPKQESAKTPDSTRAANAKAPAEAAVAQPKSAGPIAAAPDPQLRAAGPLETAMAARPKAAASAPATAPSSKAAEPTETAAAPHASTPQPKTGGSRATPSASQPESAGRTGPATDSHGRPASPVVSPTAQPSPSPAGSTAASAGQSKPGSTATPSGQPPGSTPQQPSRSPGATAASAPQSKPASSAAAAARESTARSYEEARARFAEPIPAELLVSTLRFAAEPSLPTPQPQLEGLHRQRLFWLRPALLAAAFVLTVVVAILVWQQFSVPQVRPQPTAQQPVRNIAPPPAPVAAVAEPTAAAAEPAAAPAAKPTPATRQKQPPPRQVGSVVFDSTAVRVGPSQSIAAVNVRRTEAATGPTQIVWSTVAGSAKPGVDYESVDSQVVRFHQGQGVRSLYIVIKHPPGAGKERRFTVRLEKNTKGPALGEPTEAEIIIDGGGARQL